MKNSLLTNKSYRYFVRSGTVFLDHGSLRNFGRHGFGWSRTATAYGFSGNANSPGLHYNTNNSYPSYVVARWHAFPVRCLVYQLSMIKLISKPERL